MIELVEAASELQDFLTARHWRFCFIGGLALQQWGEQRLTRDVDVTLLTGFGEESAVVDPLLARFRGRLPDVRAFALQNRVLLIQSTSGIPLDIALGALPFEAEAVARSRPVAFAAGVLLQTCSAEDLVVMKAFADRERDWADIEGILIRQGGSLDWAYVERHLKPLAEVKEAPGIMRRLSDLRRRLEA